MKKIIFLILILSICGCSQNKIPKGAYLDFGKNKFEVYSAISINDVVEKTNVNIINEDLKTNTLGKQKIKIKYLYNNKEYYYKYEYEIIDSTSPKIFGGTNKTVLVNYEKDICNLITYIDNYDEYLTCEINGDYDLNSEGTYKLEYVISDSSNNKSTYHLNLNVVEKINNNSNNVQTEKLNFSDALANYKNDNNELGIDVSKWQGDIDFNAVRDAGATFVMIRIGSVMNKEDGPIIDPYYENNIKNAKEAGLKVGVYFYSKALESKNAIEEAKWVINTLDNVSLDLPVVFDWEIWSNFNSYHLSYYSLNDLAKTFLNYIEDKGYKASLYGSKFYLENFWTDDYENIWLAHYTKKTNYEGYKIWQFSNIGQIAGINGDVDLNILIK